MKRASRCAANYAAAAVALKAHEDASRREYLSAMHALEGFVNVVQAQRGERIPEGEAAALIWLARQIMALLGG